MSCQEFHADLLLHADGELLGQASLHLLAHLKDCPECARRVCGQQQLKASISRVMGELKAPSTLRASVVTVLEADRVPSPAAIPSPPRVLRLHRPTAIAALIGLAVIAAWQFQPWAGKPSTAAANLRAVNVTDDSPTAVELAKNIHKLHVRCATLGTSHPDSNLSTDPNQAANQLTALLGVPVLSGEQLRLTSGKARFDNAHLCSLLDARNQSHRIAHMLYRDHSGEAVSILSMPLFTEITSLKTRSVDGQSYAILEPGVSTKCHPFTIVAWSGNRANYLVCAPFGEEETMASVEPLRVALDGDSPLPGLFLASLDR